MSRHLDPNERLALRRTWLLSNLAFGEVADLYGVHENTARRILNGFKRSGNLDDIDYGQLRTALAREIGYPAAKMPELSWTASLMLATEIELSLLHNQKAA